LLPEHIRNRAVESYRLFSQDPYHPSLRFKQVIRPGQSIPFGSARNIERWVSEQTMKLFGSGSGRILNTNGWLVDEASIWLVEED
jgi:hypothetical protein